MTKLLKEAFEEASKLSEDLQDQLAHRLLRELADEAKWDAALAASPEALESMADQALREHENDETEEIGFDDL